MIDHGPQYKVMTNSPIYSDQLKLYAYWSNRNRNQELPGSIQSPDRFVHGSYYNQQLPTTSDTRQALAGVMSVMRNVSPTWWRSLIDQKNNVYYFDSALSGQRERPAQAGRTHHLPGDEAVGLCFTCPDSTSPV